MTSSDPTHWMAATVAIILWISLTLVTVVGAWAARRRRLQAARPSAADITLVAFASQTGFAEDLAIMTARALTDAGQTAQVVSFADLDLAMLTTVRRTLFVVSTTGEGDAPDSATRVVRRLMSQTPDLSGLSYALMALGDRSYRDFCGFGHAVDGWLRRANARPLFDPVEVDDADPAAIRHWQHQLTNIAGAAAAPDWTPPAYDRWRLVERALINPGSPGGPVFHLAFEPLDGPQDWVAGDVAEIGLPALEGERRPGAREYSIASLPADGRVELLVRLTRRSDGSPGLASSWLTQTLAIGDEAVDMRIRTNRAFHGPALATPLILIGNGTGIAGLRAHLKARAGANGGTWLMFGERTAAHDAFYDAELQAWIISGALTRLDRTFSRDPASQNPGHHNPGEGRYVQALIAEHAAEVADWVDRGATLLVCGSLEGMASGVHAALEQALGDERLIDLTESGRYRRDVY